MQARKVEFGLIYAALLLFLSQKNQQSGLVSRGGKEKASVAHVDFWPCGRVNVGSGGGRRDPLSEPGSRRT